MFALFLRNSQHYRYKGHSSEIRNIMSVFLFFSPEGVQFVIVARSSSVYCTFLAYDRFALCGLFVCFFLFETTYSSTPLSNIAKITKIVALSLPDCSPLELWSGRLALVFGTCSRMECIDIPAAWCFSIGFRVCCAALLLTFCTG